MAIIQSNNGNSQHVAYFILEYPLNCRCIDFIPECVQSKPNGTIDINASANNPVALAISLHAGGIRETLIKRVCVHSCEHVHYKTIIIADKRYANTTPPVLLDTNTNTADNDPGVPKSNIYISNDLLSLICFSQR